jgi:uridine phosphorylase
MWEGDYVFLDLLRREEPFFSLKLVYVNDRLTDAILNGKQISTPGIPLMEFDPSPAAVINPDHEKLNIHLPEKCVFAFLGDAIDDYAHKVDAAQVATFVSMTRDFPIYVTEYQGEQICICRAPVGSAAAAQLMDWLIGYGVKKIVCAGSCGALEQIDEGTFLIPTRALRDEGASYHYAPPSRFIDLCPEVTALLAQTVQAHGLTPRTVTTWSTDGFYRETPAKVTRRRAEGCSTVEMECAALAACAQLRGARFGMLLYTADTLADVAHYDERNWGGDANAYALRLCLDAVLKL